MDLHVETGGGVKMPISKRKLFSILVIMTGTCLATVEYIANIHIRHGQSRRVNLARNKMNTASTNLGLDVKRKTLVNDPLSGDVIKSTTTSSPVMSLSPPKPEVTRVLLLSYQRSGSSFVGEIFVDPEEAFYVYEPLDPLYAAMYGIEDGWSIPSDIFSNKDGKLRDIPKHELEASEWLLEKVYNCEMSSLPPAMLAHAFWYMFNFTMTHTDGYIKCLRAGGIDPSSAHEKCQRCLKDFCGFRYRQKEKNQQQCLEYLWGSESISSADPPCIRNRRALDRGMPDHFQSYYNCLAKMDPVLTKCAVEHFDVPCRSKTLRAIKTVRGNMRLAASLMQRHENLYLIHLFRDPRGAVRSRIKATWSQGYYSKGSFAREATLYCSQVLDDVRRRLEMEKDPNLAERIRQLIYDGFTQEPLLNTLDLYNFFHKNASMYVKNRYMANRIKPRSSNSEAISLRWTKALTPEEIDAINTHCSDLMAEVSFDWMS